MRKVLERIFNADEQLQVVGSAKDGREAVAMAEALKPDVITMDINMPHVDGLQATAEIMTTNPRPIVVVSTESRDGAASTLRALELGAIEFVAKPSSGIDLDMQSVKEDLLRKVRMAPSFTADFPAAVILVQHMPAAFTTQFAAQLAEFTGMRVKEAEANESLQPGTLYICPGGQHLRVMPTGRIQLDGTSGRINGYLPNIDATMESVAAFAGPLSIAGVLTGMGNDGASGAKAIKAAGGLVVAQDEATSVIFGMPDEAIKAGAVDQVLGIDDIYAAIEKRVLGICRTAPAGVR